MLGITKRFYTATVGSLTFNPSAGREASVKAFAYTTDSATALQLAFWDGTSATPIGEIAVPVPGTYYTVGSFVATMQAADLPILTPSLGLRVVQTGSHNNTLLVIYEERPLYWELLEKEWQYITGRKYPTPPGLVDMIAVNLGTRQDKDYA